MTTSLASATAALDPLMQQYYQLQQRNVTHTYQMGLAQNKESQNLSDLSYQQKLAALNDRLGQEQNVLPDKFAARGLMNSGIWNYNGPGQMGAKQQFAYDSALSRSNLTNQQQGLDNQFAQHGSQLGTAYQDQMAGLQNQNAIDQSRQAINDAIMGV